MRKILSEFIRKNIVLVISWVLALTSMIFYKPSAEYFDYINFDVLILLFCMMIVVEGFFRIGFFKAVACILFKKINDTRKLTFCFIFLCFFFSMLITNDVALITFVPFTIMTLKFSEFEKNILYIVILETIAANLGSMATPIGNPQNLYLYSISEMDIINFFKITVPYMIVSLIILIFFCFFVKKEKLKDLSYFNAIFSFKNFKLYIYFVLFCLCTFSVLKILDYYILFFIVLCIIFFIDRKLFLKVDYVLLLTFIGFFIFVGNIGKIPEISNTVKEIFTGNEVVISVALSQIISNVPAALFLSGISDNYENIIIGVNIGGLGTLIASMASLISYKYYIKTENSKGKKYIIIFTLVNFIFLIFLILFYFFKKMILNFLL